MSERQIQPYESDAYKRILEKLEHEERLTPEEQALVVEGFVLTLGYLAHGVARLVKSAIDRLASQEVRSSLERVSRHLEERARTVDRHQRQIEAEHEE